MVIEESLNQLPFSKCVVTTPTGASYQGLKYQKGNCGVSIVRSGEAMEQVLSCTCILSMSSMPTVAGHNFHKSLAVCLKEIERSVTLKGN
jgi:uracil phosphoribosyltransferase